MARISGPRPTMVTQVAWVSRGGAVFRVRGLALSRALGHGKFRGRRGRVVIRFFFSRGVGMAYSGPFASGMSRSSAILP